MTYRTLGLATIGALVVLAGCSSVPGGKAGEGSGTSAAPAAASTATASKIGPGMNDRGEVIDPTKVEPGYGQKVKGINDWEGEITGKPVPGSKFSELKIGMSFGQVQGILGVPSDQGSYITGKAFIPFFFGSDRYRHEAVYKGQGRLIFAGSAGFDMNAHLIWIINSANETGVR
ncbi:MAG: hypothetical protein U1E63_04710 [Burkholderiales bacterium]